VLKAVHAADLLLRTICKLAKASSPTDLSMFPEPLVVCVPTIRLPAAHRAPAGRRGEDGRGGRRVRAHAHEWWVVIAHAGKQCCWWLQLSGKQHCVWVDATM